MSNPLMTAATIGVVALVTALVRGLPYILFGGSRKIPRWVAYLGGALPPSIMVILVVYCLRNINLTAFPYGLAELISVGLVMILQVWKGKTFLSIFTGTACYMILIRTVFM